MVNTVKVKCLPRVDYSKAIYKQTISLESYNSMKNPYHHSNFKMPETISTVDQISSVLSQTKFEHEKDFNSFIKTWRSHN